MVARFKIDTILDRAWYSALHYIIFDAVHRSPMFDVTLIKTV
jgi:hypothetical protein